METAIDYYEEIELEMQSFPEWYECPECGHAGVKSDLENFGHSCCKAYIAELEGDITITQNKDNLFKN